VTEEQQAAAQARLDAIERGHWPTPQWYYDRTHCGIYAKNFVDLADGEQDDPYFIANTNSSSKRYVENAEFIAHAPEDLRAALAALKRLRLLPRYELINEDIELDDEGDIVMLPDVLAAIDGTEVKP